MADLRFEKDGIKIPSINIAPVSKIINITEKYTNSGKITQSPNHVGTFEIIEFVNSNYMYSALDKLYTLWNFDDYDSVNHILTWGNNTIEAKSLYSCYWYYNNYCYDSYTMSDLNSNETDAPITFIKTDRNIIMIGTNYSIFVGYATNALTGETVKCAGHISSDNYYASNFYLDDDTNISCTYTDGNGNTLDAEDGFYSYNALVSSSKYIIDKLAYAIIIGRTSIRSPILKGEYLIQDTPMYLIGRFAIIDSVLTSTELNNMATSKVLDSVASNITTSPELVGTVDLNLENTISIRDFFMYNPASGSSIINSCLNSVTANNCSYVGTNAFTRIANLKRVSIGTNLNSGNLTISTMAFDTVTDLQTVDLPTNGVNVVLKDSAFTNCKSLTNIDISVISNIGSSAFVNCAINEVNNSKLTLLPSSVFANCVRLTTVNLPNVTSIYSSAFSNCNNLVSISIPNVTVVGSSVFSNTLITDLDLPKLANIGSNTAIFERMSCLVNLNIPNVTGNLSAYTFRFCSNLTSMNLPNITNINYSSIFLNCSNLVTVDFPNNTSTTIGDYAFANCIKLTSINIPNIKTIGPYAFYNCTNMVNFDFTNIVNISSNGFNGSGLSGSVVIPNVVSIESEVFSNCSKITDIILNNTTTLKQFSFFNCINLVSVNAPKVTTLQANIFRQCTSLSNIILPNVSTINNSTFYACSNLKSYDFANTVTANLRNHSFANSGLITVNLPERITALGTYVFSNCVNLANVTISNTGAVPDYTFDNCHRLERLNLTKNSVISTTATSLYRTKIKAGGGFIVVPDNLVSSYKSANYWKNMSNQIIGVSDEPNMTITESHNLFLDLTFVHGYYRHTSSAQPVTWVENSASLISSNYVNVEPGTYTLYVEANSRIAIQADVLLSSTDSEDYYYKTYSRFSPAATISPLSINITESSKLKLAVYYNQTNVLDSSDINTVESYLIEGNTRYTINTIPQT